MNIQEPVGHWLISVLHLLLNILELNWSLVIGANFTFCSNFTDGTVGAYNCPARIFILQNPNNNGLHFCNVL